MFTIDLICGRGHPSIYFKTRIIQPYIQGWSDKYLASRHDGAIIAREIYYRVVLSLRWLLSKFNTYIYIYIK